MVKKGVKKKSTSKKDTEKIIIENFASLQKVLTNLTSKFDELSKNISKLLELFEVSANALTEKEINLESSGNKEILDELKNLSNQNKTIARGLTLMHEKFENGKPEEPTPRPEKGSISREYQKSNLP